MKRPVTQKDIAASLGISKLTVHRALASSGYVSRELCARILARAKQLGYAPNRSARALLHKERYAIELFSTAEPAFFWKDVGAGVSIAAKQVAGYGVAVRYTRIPYADTSAYLRQLSRAAREGVDALALVNNVEYDMERIFAFVQKREIPYITMNIDAPETNRICFVGPDYRQGGRIAAELLDNILPAGARVTAFFHRFHERTHLASARISQAMYAGFAARLQERGSSLAVDVETIDHDISDRQTMALLHDYFHANGARIQGIFCIGTMQDPLGRLLESTGHGGRIKVITVDVIPQTKRFLSSKVFAAAIYQNPTLQGYYAVKVLENFLETGKKPQEDTLLVHDILVSENIDLHRNYEPLIRMQY